MNNLAELTIVVLLFKSRWKLLDVGCVLEVSTIAFHDRNRLCERFDTVDVSALTGQVERGVAVAVSNILIGSGHYKVSYNFRLSGQHC